MAAHRRASLTQKHLSSPRAKKLIPISLEDSVSIQPNDSASKVSSNNFNRQAALYSLAAAVAGVSILALAEPALAEVVVTHKTIPIPLSHQGEQDPVKISLANNRIDNFIFILSSGLSFRDLDVHGVTQNDGVIDGGTWSASAMALPPGKQIGPKNSDFWYGYARVESSVSYPTAKRFRGYWGGNPTNKYLGVRFQINGQFHYGWIRMTITTSKQVHGPIMSAEITEYAYETKPNQPIYAGETKTADIRVPANIQDQAGPSLGMLAVGADGLALWRRDGTSTSR